MMTCRSVFRSGAWAALGLLSLAGSRLQAQGFSDSFASRAVLTDASGTLAGNNRGATSEPGEPRHGDNAGRHSVWISWRAPDNGFVTFALPSGSFDTLIAAYRREPGDGTDLERLRRVARDDDSGPERSTLIQFGVELGQRYEVAVDGYGWQTGDFVFHWEFLGSASPLPAILGTPSNLALRLGDTLTLSMDLQITEELHLRWYRNGTELDTEDQPTLEVPNLTESDLGQYRVRLSVDDFRIWSEPIEVQVNSEGLATVLARDKLLDALSDGLEQDPGTANLSTAASGTHAQPALRPMGPTPGVVRGYQGTQIFNTSIGDRDPAEPAHCGVNLGPTYWFAYQPPEAGIATLDTAGSSFDTVLTLYAFDPPIRSYDDLRLVVCDDNGGPDPLSSLVRFVADPTQTYCLVVCGAAGDSGVAHLNYLLDTNAIPDTAPPILGCPPASQTVAPGMDVVFSAAVAGAVPLQIVWLKNNAPIPGATNASLRLQGVQPSDAGAYHAQVSNPFGSSATATARLRIVDAPRFNAHLTGGELTFSVTATPGSLYSLERTEHLGSGLWTPLDVSAVADTSALVLTIARPVTAPGFYRITTK